MEFRLDSGQVELQQTVDAVLRRPLPARRRRRARGGAGRPRPPGRDWRRPRRVRPRCCPRTRAAAASAWSRPRWLFEQLGSHLVAGPAAVDRPRRAARRRRRDRRRALVGGIEAAAVEDGTRRRRARRRPRRAARRRRRPGRRPRTADLAPPDAARRRSTRSPRSAASSGSAGGEPGRRRRRRRRAAAARHRPQPRPLLVGVAARALEVARAYAARARTSSACPIGSFQAVKHLLADMYVRTAWPRAPPTRRPRSSTIPAATTPAARPRRPSCSPPRPPSTTPAPPSRCSAAWASPGTCSRNYLLKRAWVLEQAFGVGRRPRPARWARALVAVAMTADRLLGRPDGASRRSCTRSTTAPRPSRSNRPDQLNALSPQMVARAAAGLRRGRGRRRGVDASLVTGNGPGVLHRRRRHRDPRRRPGRLRRALPVDLPAVGGARRRARRRSAR